MPYSHSVTYFTNFAEKDQSDNVADDDSMPYSPSVTYFTNFAEKDQSDNVADDGL